MQWRSQSSALNEIDFGLSERQHSEYDAECNQLLNFIIIIEEAIDELSALMLGYENGKLVTFSFLLPDRIRTNPNPERQSEGTLNNRDS